MQNKRQEPGKGREEQMRSQRPGQAPVHPDTAQPSRGRGGEETERERRREEDLLRDERDLREDDF
ncbi:hypothetical protein ACIRUY_29745 [Streptomyces erythrochromogenes]|uniref:hypothetical protein n=1 Tax=Streptomyces erythrochromogenes TaxID=285574 RepID=UPI00343145F7